MCENLCRHTFYLGDYNRIFLKISKRSLPVLQLFMESHFNPVKWEIKYFLLSSKSTKWALVLLVSDDTQKGQWLPAFPVDSFVFDAIQLQFDQRDAFLILDGKMDSRIIHLTKNF